MTTKQAFIDTAEKAIRYIESHPEATLTEIEAIECFLNGACQMACHWDERNGNKIFDIWLKTYLPKILDYGWKRRLAKIEEEVAKEMAKYA